MDCNKRSGIQKIHQGNVNSERSAETVAEGDNSLDENHGATWNSLSVYEVCHVLSFAPLDEIASWSKVHPMWKSCADSITFWNLVKENQIANGAFDGIPKRILDGSCQVLKSLFFGKLLTTNFITNPTGIDDYRGWTSVGQFGFQNLQQLGNGIVFKSKARVFQQIDLDQFGLDSTTLGELLPVIFVATMCVENVSAPDTPLGYLSVQLLYPGGSKVLRICCLHEILGDTSIKRIRVRLSSNESWDVYPAWNKLYFAIETLFSDKESKLKISDLEIRLQVVESPPLSVEPECDYGFDII